jgi:methylated-DNA-[protein]-cysteine S-methyltransferase
MKHLTIDSPLGPVTLSAEGDDIVGLAIGIRHADSESTPLLERAKTQLGEYFSHTRTTFELPLHVSGTAFQEAIWDTLQSIPHGQTLSYQALGEKAGRGNAPRAVGGAVGRNPIPILIPCHRILASDGRITGYSGGEGIPTKAKLLDLEGITYR